MSANQDSTWIKAAPWVYTIALFAIWEGAVHLFRIPKFILPAPSAIAAKPIASESMRST